MKRHEEWLNNTINPSDSNEWIIGGKLRFAYLNMQIYGTALRKFDPIAFRVSYQERKLEY